MNVNTGRIPRIAGPEDNPIHISYSLISISSDEEQLQLTGKEQPPKTSTHQVRLWGKVAEEPVLYCSYGPVYNEDPNGKIAAELINAALQAFEIVPVTLLCYKGSLLDRHVASLPAASPIEVRGADKKYSAYKIQPEKLT